MNGISDERLHRLSLHYLGYRENQAQKPDADLLASVERACGEVAHYAQFCGFLQVFTLREQTITELELPLASADLVAYFSGCDRVAVIGGTLGFALERYLKRQQRLDMSYGVIADACASAYLETSVDAYQASFALGPHTFRLAPGYGDIPLALNADLCRMLQLEKKLGITQTESGLFLPQKSMLCLIGLGQQLQHKSCGSCIRKDFCQLRKENLRCYSD